MKILIKRYSEGGMYETMTYLFNVNVKNESLCETFQQYINEYGKYLVLYQNYFLHTPRLISSVYAFNPIKTD